MPVTLKDISKKAQADVKDNSILVPSLIELEMSRNILISFKNECQDEIDKILKKYNRIVQKYDSKKRIETYSLTTEITDIVSSLIKNI